jgi:hypothetical protein
MFVEGAGVGGSFSASTFNFYVFPEPVEGVQVRVVGYVEGYVVRGS